MGCRRVEEKAEQTELTWCFLWEQTVWRVDSWCHKGCSILFHALSEGKKDQTRTGVLLFCTIGHVWLWSLLSHNQSINCFCNENRPVSAVCRPVMICRSVVINVTTSPSVHLSAACLAVFALSQEWRSATLNLSTLVYINASVAMFGQDTHMWKRW